MKSSLFILGFFLAVQSFGLTVPPELHGNWIQEKCTYVGEDTSFKRTLTFSGTTMRARGVFYNSTPSCDGVEDHEQVETYELLSVGLPGEFDIQFIDFEFVKAESTPLTRKGAGNNSYNSLCGFRNWKAGVTKDITGLNCGGYTAPDAGQKLYSLIKVAQDGDARFMYLGTKSSKTPENRPVDINYNVSYLHLR